MRELDLTAVVWSLAGAKFRVLAFQFGRLSLPFGRPRDGRLHPLTFEGITPDTDVDLAATRAKAITSPGEQEAARLNENPT